MQTKSTRNLWRGANPLRRPLVVAIALAFATNLFGEGFRNPPPGTFDLGRAGGRIAQVDDASAVQSNPANLVNLTNYEAELTPSVVYIGVDYEGSGADNSARTTDPWKLLPNFFATAPINDRVAVGLGISVPYGLSMQWNENSPAFQNPAAWRYQAPYYTSLTTINFNPTVAFKITDNLSAGVGFDAMWSELTLKQFYPMGLWGGSADGAVKGEGDGVGYGFNFGLTWKITDHQRVAVTYRAPMDVDYSGDFRVNNLPGAARSAGVVNDSTFNTTIKYPTIIGIGYGLDVTPKLRVESDFEYLQFSRFQSLNLNFGRDNVLFNPGGRPTNIAEDWNDTFTAGIAGDYAINDRWMVRAGYQFYLSPVPDKTFSPTIPDADQNVFTLGLAYHHGHSTLEASYGLDFYGMRRITNDQNPAFNGRYDFTVHLFSFAYHYAF